MCAALLQKEQFSYIEDVLPVYLCIFLFVLWVWCARARCASVGVCARACVSVCARACLCVVFVRARHARVCVCVCLCDVVHRLWGVLTLVWAEARVNHRFLFEMDPASSPSAVQARQTNKPPLSRDLEALAVSDSTVSVGASGLRT